MGDEDDGANRSPYHTYQGVTCDMELTLGNRQDKKNMFKWERVVKNYQEQPFMAAVGHGCIRRGATLVLQMICLFMWTMGGK